jgi:hypothetical protein
MVVEFDKGILYIPYMVLKLENKDGTMTFAKANGKIEIRTNIGTEKYPIEIRIYNDYRQNSPTYYFYVKEFEYKMYGRDII